MKVARTVPRGEGNIRTISKFSFLLDKKIFSKKGNEDILKDFLEAILNIKIEKIEIKNPELTKTTKKEKTAILDIKVETKNKIIDVEMQMKNEGDIPERITAYLGKLVSNQLEPGDKYKKLKETIIIFILNFNLYKRNSYHNIAKMRFEKTTKEAYVNMGYKTEEEIATKYMQIHIIELPKFKKKNADMKKRINQWLYLLTGKEKEMKIISDEKVRKAMKTLEQIRLDPKEREIYDSIQMAEFLSRIRETKNYEKGLKKGKREIIRKMIIEEIPMEQIYKITELSKKEIEEIRKTIKTS